MDQFSFKFDAYGGLGEVRGVLQFDGEQLRLHYQVADAMLGAIRSQPREVAFAPEAVLDIAYSAGWFWLMPRVELQVSDVARIADIPLETAGSLRLHLPFSQRRVARRLVESLALPAASVACVGSIPSWHGWVGASAARHCRPIMRQRARRRVARSRSSCARRSRPASRSC
ncbi:MAG TPA: hypothetical protein VFY12_08700 [Arenimonas sp.]|nr:hypothetical protein [Arenimonas sp.]